MSTNCTETKEAWSGNDVDECDVSHDRCIKPNLDLQPGRFDSHVVMAQLQSSGLLEVTRVRKEGYPIRIMFAHFVTR